MPINPKKKLQILLTFCFGNHNTHIIHFSEFQKLLFIIYILNLYFRILHFSNVNFHAKFQWLFNYINILPNCLQFFCGVLLYNSIRCN